MLEEDISNIIKLVRFNNREKDTHLKVIFGNVELISLIILSANASPSMNMSKINLVLNKKVITTRKINILSTIIKTIY
jgi:hypothetical protein